MQILHSIAELASLPGPVFLAIGVFDGVHLGHQAVIGRALCDATAAGGTAVVVTFSPHPIRLTRPEQAPRLLTADRHKAALIEQLGVPALLILPFTPELAATPAQDFILALHHACRPLREIVVGHTWSFGKNRSGNLALLQQMGDQLGFEEIGLPAITVGGEIISSTLIRASVEMGDLEKAKRLLGRDFSLAGTVEHGEQIGRSIGFPTANLSAHSEQFPPNGVYAVTALHSEKPLPGVVNIGVRPTIHPGGGQRTFELHLFDFHADLYGQEIEVIFHRFIRPEQRFANLDALKAQIADDIRQARQILQAE